MASEDYLTALKTEKENLDEVYVNAVRLLSEEIDRVERGAKYTEVHNDKKLKLTEKVLIPVKEHPKFNFVGKLLGPQGNSLKRLQAETGTKMSILGKGSMRDKKKQEDDVQKEADPKFKHLNEDLHVLVEVFCPASEAHSRMAHALIELRKFLVPDYNDEIRQQQLQELMYINGDKNNDGNPPPVPPPPAVRGRGRGRGIPPLPPPARGARGGALLATPPGRGGPVGRGLPARGAPAPRARGAPAGRGLPPPVRSAYEYEDGYGYEDQSYAYGAESYRDGYDSSYAGVGESGYYDYEGAGTGREAAYEYGEYGDAWGNGTAVYGKAPPPRPKADYRAHPYGSAGGRGRY